MERLPKNPNSAHVSEYIAFWTLRVVIEQTPSF